MDGQRRSSEACRPSPPLRGGSAVLRLARPFVLAWQMAAEVGRMLEKMPQKRPGAAEVLLRAKAMLRSGLKK